MSRNDIHSPTNFDPADYAYIGTFDNWPEPGMFVSPTTADYETPFGAIHALNYENAEYRAGRDLLRREGCKIHFDVDSGDQNCDHCGARIRYVSIYRHKDGQCLAVGSTCSEERFGCDSRREFEVKRLKERAASQRERMAAFGAANDFVQANCSEMAEWLLSPSANDVHTIFADLARKLIRFGTLSEKQIELARKLLREHFEKERNGGKTDQQLEWDAEKAKAEDCPKGRVLITGSVIKVEVRESDFGDTLKMVVKDDRGFCVWMTVPDSLAIIDDGEFQRGLGKGDRITVTATLTPSDKDPKFGFGKRPSRGKIVPA